MGLRPGQQAVQPHLQHLVDGAGLERLADEGPALRRGHILHGRRLDAHELGTAEVLVHELHAVHGIGQATENLQGPARLGAHSHELSHHVHHARVTPGRFGIVRLGDRLVLDLLVVAL